MSAQVMAMPQRSVASDSPAVNTTPLTDAVVRGAQRLGLTDQQFADLLGLSPQLYSKQKHGTEGHRLHVQRFDALPADYRELFLRAVVEELARTLGLTVVAPGGHLAHLARTMRGLSDTLEALSVQAALPFGKVAGQ